MSNGGRETTEKVIYYQNIYECLVPTWNLGRHVLIVPRSHSKNDTPKVTSNWRAVARGIWRMCTVFAWWDVSWWIGVLFSFGSMIFILSACFYWIPIAYPDTEFPGESLTGGGVTSFIGATLFQIGAVLLIVEAVNENQVGCFGWALEQAFSHEHDKESVEEGRRSGAHALIQHCFHHHASGLHKTAQPELQHPDAGRKWQWWPTWHELHTHYWYEIGFQASFQLAIGATIFYVSGIMALPGIENKLSEGALQGSFWLTYLVGGVLFIISSAFYILETQVNWYTPAPHVLGWWIGVWNIIGSVGWTISASFG